MSDIEIRDPLTVEPGDGARLVRAPLHGRGTLAIVAGALGAVLGVSALIGALAARTEAGAFDWELAALIGTALGTTLLAGVTGALAWTTNRDVQATQQLAVLAERREELERRPTVMVLRFRYPFYDLVTEREFARLHGVSLIPASDTYRNEINATLFNVGLGPAFDVRVQARYADSSPPQPEFTAAAVPAIPSGGTADIAIGVSFGDAFPERIDARSFDLVGSYADRTGRTRWRLITEWAEKVVPGSP